MPFTLPLLWTAALGLGCGQKTWADCETDACRRGWVEAHFADDPVGVTEQVLALPDPVARLDLALVVARRWPQDAGRMCRGLSDQEANRKCHTVIRRPHLWVDAPPPGVPPGQATSGARTPTTGESPSPTLAHRVRLLPAGVRPAVDPHPGSCAVGDGHCLQRAAFDAARLGRLDDVAPRCLAVPDPVWVDECFFRAAEGVLGPQTADGKIVADFAPAFALCRATGAFQGHCLMHLAGDIARRAPPGDTPAEGWTPIIAGVAEGRRVTAAVDPVLAERFEDYVWSRGTWRSIAQTAEPTGDLLDHLPPQAHPHVRAAVAWRIVSESRASSVDVDALVSQVEAALARRSTAPGPRIEPGPPPRLTAWGHVDDAPGPVVHFLGDAVRVQAATDMDDVVVCVLESLARLAPDQLPEPGGATAHRSPAIQWAWARLLEVPPGASGRPDPPEARAGP